MLKKAGNTIARSQRIVFCVRRLFLSVFVMAAILGLLLVLFGRFLLGDLKDAITPYSQAQRPGTPRLKLQHLPVSHRGGLASAETPG